MQPDQLKHLEFAQGVISRLAGNSFALKGWGVTLVAGIVALAAANDGDHRLVYVAIIPVVMFWGLDAYYLMKERHYRALYRLVATGSTKVPPMSLSVPAKLDREWRRALFASPVTVGFWLALVICVIGSAVVLCWL